MAVHANKLHCKISEKNSHTNFFFEFLSNQSESDCISRFRIDLDIKEFCLDPNQTENGNYNPNLVSIYNIQKIFLRMQ